MQNYLIECLSDVPNDTKIAIRVRRDSDNKFYDPIDKKFVDDITTPIAGVSFGLGFPNRYFIQMKPGVVFNQNRVSATLEIDPKEFTDGNYSVMFHDLNSTVLAQYEQDEFIVIYGVAKKVYSVTDIAIRLFDVAIGAKKFRQVISEIYNKVMA